MKSKSSSLIATVSAALLVLTSIQPANAVDAYTPGSIPQKPGHIDIVLDDGVYVGGNATIKVWRIFERWDNGSTSMTIDTGCEALNQAPCDLSKVGDPDYHFSAEMNMPICESATQEFCIEQIQIYKAGTSPVDATFIGYGGGPSVTPNQKLKLPGGKPVALFQGAVNHAGGTATYALQTSGQFQFEKGVFDLRNLAVAVIPYEERFDPTVRAPEYYDLGDGKKGLSPWGGEGYIWSDAGKYGFIQDFTLDTRVKLKLRIPNQIKGWLKGRVTEPEFSSTRFSKTANLVTLDASPVVVPRLRVLATDAQRTPMMKKYQMWSDGRPQSTSGMFASAEGEWAINWVNDLKEVAKDTAAGQSSVWQYDATKWGTGGCDAKSNGISGIVFTNSMAYAGNAPKLIKGFLDYKVAGFHYLPDGTEAIGTYDLVMNSDVARCLYGFSKAPVSATITISGEGDKNIATTVVSEKNGWLKLGAYGFTYSEKTIKVKLTQKKQTTITCIAPGKKTKKVTAAKPKCPSGFKKK